MVTTFYPPYNFGGDGTFVHRLANELAQRGHQVDVIHCIDSYRVLAGSEPEARYDNHPNIAMHGLKSRFGFWSPLATQQSGFPVFKSTQVRRILKQKFDVIHYHNISLVGGPKILEYGEGIKLYTMHEYWLICPTHMLFQDNRQPCQTPKCLRCTLLHKRPPQWWRYFGLINKSSKHIDAFIAPSRLSKEKHSQSGFNAPIFYIPYFTPRPQKISTVTHRENHDNPYFLFVGRLEKIKGLQTLIPIFRRFRKARLLVAGSGNFGPTLQRLAADCNNIEFLGHQTAAQLEFLYQHAVAVIVPSIWFEVFGLVIIEAFAQKTPVIVRNIGEMPAIVRESGGGLVYDSDEALVAAIDGLLTDHQYRQRLGIAGYQAYQLKWTPDAHIDKYFKLIEFITDNRHSASTLPQ